MKKRSVVFLTLTVCMLFMASMAAGCGSGGAGNSAATTAPSETPSTIAQDVVSGADRIADPNGTIVYGMDGSPNNDYNFYTAKTTRLMIVTDTIFDKLVYVSKNGQIEPRAAESWEWAEDGKSITFHLRPAFFHDGEPVTAEDWAWTIKAVCNAELHDVDVTTKICQYLDGVDPATGDELSEDSANIEVVDDHTFIMYLNNVYNRTSFELSTLSYLVVYPKHLFTNPDGSMMSDVDAFDGKYAEFYRSPVGSGPAKFVEDELDSYTRLEAFDQYYGYGPEGPQFKYIVYQYVSDANQIGSKIVAGDIDVAYPGVSEEDAQFYTGNPAINMVESASEVMQIDINFDCAQTPKYIRLAMNYVIDKQFILDSIYGGRGAAGGGSLVMPSYKYYAKIGDERDVELAKSYYEQAIANGSWSEDMAVSLNVPNDTYEACANIVKANCAEIGLKVDVIRRDSIPTIQQNMFFAPTEGYMAVLWSFAPTIDPAKVGIYLQKEYTDDNFFARWGVREEDAADNQGYTDAFHLWAGAQTPEDEKKYAEELQRWENEGAPCIAICNVRAIYACGTNVAGADSPWIDVTGVNYYSQDVWNWICYQK